MRRIIRLTESDLTKIVRRVIQEESSINPPEVDYNGTPDYKGFALGVVGRMLPALDSWGFDGGASNQTIKNELKKIDNQGKYDAVLELCKTSPVLKKKYGYKKEQGYYNPSLFPFYTVMALIHRGYSTNIFNAEDNYKTLEGYATYLRRYNPDEKVIIPNKP